MTLYDLIFIATFFLTLGILIAAGTDFLRGRDAKAARKLRRLCLFLAVYLAAVAIVGLASPQKTLDMNENECFDDVCFAATNADILRAVGNPPQAAAAGDVFYLVTVRVSSRARARVQRAKDAAVELVDSQRRRYSPSAAGQAAYEAAIGPASPLSGAVAPGESFSSVRVFEGPANAGPMALVVIHGAWPEWFIIGDSMSLFHKPTIIRLVPIDRTLPASKN